MIKLININKYYKSGSENYHALRDINLEFGDSGMHFIHGKSGSGKSTLLNVLGGLDKYDSGDLIIDNVSTAAFTKKDFNTYRNTYIGFVFQEFNVLKGLSVYENIALSLELQHMSVKQNHDKIQEIIDKVGLTGLENRMMNQISGGQRQRVAIARALIKNPRVIIADEPTGNLDSKNSKMVMDLLKELSKDHLIIVVTHSDTLAHEYADRLIEIRDGSVTKDTGNTSAIDKDLVLDPVKVPVKTSLSLSLKSIFKNKFRFIVMILLFALSLTFAGVVVNLSLADTTKVYSEYQNDYANFVLNINKKYLSRGIETTTAFFDYELLEYQEKYNEDENGYIKVLKGMDYFIPIDENATTEDPFWVNYIQRIHLYDSKVLSNFEFLYGKHVNATNAVTITDYLADNLIYQNYFGDSVKTRKDLLNKEIYCDEMKEPFIIRGILKTNYEEFLTKDLNDSKTWSAFEDNLVFYSSMFTNQENYMRIYSSNNFDFVYDDVIFDLINKKGICEDVKITTYDKATGTVHATMGKEPTKPKDGEPTQIAVTTGFLKKVTGLDGTIDELFNKIYFEVTYEKTAGNYVTEYMYATVYINAISRVPTSVSCVITDIIEDDEAVIYAPALKNTDLYTKILAASYGDGGFMTLISDTLDGSEAVINTNAEAYRDMIENDVLISNKAFQKVLLVDDFINNNLWLFIGIFFVFGLFSVLLIFNFVIINIKNSTRDIGIYMSLGLSGFRISLIYFFQVIIMGLCAFILAAIAVVVFLLILDIRFTALAAVNLTIINITALGMIAILAISIIVPVSAVVIPLLDLSRKHPVDVIKSV
ncbi:MAG: ABC transporter ATP-binding protein/permease [Bacilli bacterium]|nr:ABC transporter ATP-binding protein/permease [Bacilli bacterium]